MSNDTIMLFGSKQEQSRPAKDIIKSSIGFEKVDDTWYVLFSTVENRKGYGKQRVPVSDFSEVVAVLKDSVTNGIHKEDEILSCPEVVRKSIVEAEDGSIRFKTEGSKGKKPTLFRNQEDFAGAVEFLSSISEMIAQKAKTLK
tara:strand:- start:20 stop:448 length:429 start_codon:yes stop_codon:yes gene_type:complete